MESNSQLESDGVYAMLLLKGGEQCELSFPSADAPLLRELFQVLLMRSQHQPYRQLFKIPIEEGRSALYVPSDSIVGIATDPPMLADGNGLIVKKFQQAELPSTYLEGDRYVQLDSFLTPEQHQRLLEFAIAQESALVESNTIGDVLDYRRSKIIYDFRGQFADLISQRIISVLPDVLRQLGLSPFEVMEIETQLTAHNDGHYYKAHDDNASVEHAKRQVSYIYYFNREPKAFSGGELRIYDCHIQNNFWLHRTDVFKTVEPRNNSIVFFFSGYLHEVMPVSCPSRNFADSRFTVNGWLRR